MPKTSRRRHFHVVAFIAWAAATATIGLGASINAASSDVPVVTTAEEAASLGAVMPDIVDQAPLDVTIEKVGETENIRFATIHWNAGDGPLQIKGGGEVGPCVLDEIEFDQCTYATQEILDADGDVVAQHPAGASLFHEAHNHWHQSAVVNFAVRRSLDGAAISPSTTKTSFCMVDTLRLKKAAKRYYWECNDVLQGVSSGWGDEYKRNTSGQSIDVTGIEPGDYYLTFDADPDQHWVESDETNNRSWLKFRATRGANGLKIAVLDSSGFTP